ncbi:MAG TPA: hypothetical protein P5080_04695 [Candidatus Paceibacterota bacterium]|nr:hypothetical protein [Candidatus Pacearchaeota archaeon]HRZ51249.1 hypothetical protein [Candidatus Paceibacterota bacterium]HSA36971.1 hypothetical protein [Candidatus Paceibacterota bacterium]
MAAKTNLGSEERVSAVLAAVTKAVLSGNWAGDEEIASIVNNIGANAENARYIYTLESLLKDSPEDSATARALSELVGKLNQCQQACQGGSADNHYHTARKGSVVGILG